MGPGEIKQLHTAMVKESNRLLETKVCVNPSRRDWESLRPSKEITFELFPANFVDGETARRGRLGRPVTVLPLFRPGTDAAPSYWVSWYEKWQKLTQPGFTLLTASWTVYRGIRTQDKAQLVRADWDQLSNMPPNCAAGQPHWHLDQPVIVSNDKSNDAPSSALREMQPLRVGAPAMVSLDAEGITVNHIHLAMGAWNPDSPHPQCWQRGARNWTEVRDWAIRTLEYLQGQFGRR
jgi:hypothetical protein